MSMHKTPLTGLERDGLFAHGMGCHIGKPSQAADIFRQGIAWALRTNEAREIAVKQREEIEAMFNRKPKAAPQGTDK
jgi:hypothetical protein